MEVLIIDTRWCAEGAESFSRCVLRALPPDRRVGEILVGKQATSTSFSWTSTDKRLPLNVATLATSCKMVSLLAGIHLTHGKRWEEVLSCADQTHTTTHTADGRSGALRTFLETVPDIGHAIEPESTSRLVSGDTAVASIQRGQTYGGTTMRFIDSITVSRVGRLPEAYCRMWTREDVRAHVARVGHTLVEYLACPAHDPRAVAPGKLFLDRDVYVGKEPPSVSDVETHMQQVREKVHDIVKRLTVPQQTRLSFVVATRHGFCAAHGQHKLSFRPFIQGMRIRYTDIPRIIEAVGQTDFWDMSVYKQSEQLLATIFGCKGRLSGVMDGRILRPEPGNDDPLKYIVQAVDDEWPFLDLPSVDTEPTAFAVPTSLPPSAGDHTPLSEIEQCFVRALMDCLGACASDDRRVWINIGLVVKGLGGGDTFYPHWLAFSERGSKFGGAHAARKTWDGLRSVSGSGAGSCGMGTLCHHAKLADSVGYEAACLARVGARGLAQQVTDTPTHKGATGNREVKRRRLQISVAPIVGAKRSSLCASARIVAAMKKFS